ncbi:MAG: acyl-CoA dehydrogenase family protein [Sandaracinaceae bacterium]|nr:acyl-CoA dehydrogenase family protein [Sandaracinaceae bacterium]
MALHDDEVITEATLVRRARALRPELEARAQEAIDLRRIPDETMRAFEASGLHLAVVPARFGGYELNPRVIFDMQLELGRACASSAWVFGVLSVHTWQLALFPEETQQEIWGAGRHPWIASSYMPVGKVQAVEGGYRLSGRWSFSSGCDRSEWIMLGSFVPVEEGAPPDMRTFLVPRSDFEIVDTWYVTGLRASGSKDVVVNDAFVPYAHTHKFSDGFRGKSPGNAQNEQPQYRFPFGQIHTRCVSTPALGAALGALEHYARECGDEPGAARLVEDCAAILDREIWVLERNFAEMSRYLAEDEGIPVPRRAHFRHDAAAAVTAAVSVVDRLADAYGRRGIFESNPMNRFFQDAHAIRAHHANQVEKPAANLGGIGFGHKNTDFFI